MERKIGEIFEYNGEWYQCVNGECKDCDFSKDTFYCKYLIEIDFCKAKSIFKKLEKAGEPFSDYYPSGRVICFQRYKCYQKPIVEEDIIWHWVDDTIVDIEIKQNKEDMEEKKLNLKPFDIQKAREGKPVCTRDGRKARIICFDRKLFYKNVSYPILALVERSDGEDDVCGYNEKGKVLIEDGAEYKDDLMILPEKKEGWVNVYKDSVYDTKDEALIGRSESRGYIDTIKISWEE